MSTRYRARYEVKFQSTLTSPTRIVVVDHEYGDKLVRPSGADTYEFYDGATADRFAELMNERDVQRIAKGWHA